jgi:UDP-glucose 4-epimerase
MKVVIFGASGNVGTALIERLLTEPTVSQVVAVARRLPASPQPAAADARVEWRSADIRYDALDAIVQDADVVVQLAWLFQPSHRREATWHNNVIGAVRVLEAVERCGVGSLVVSSSVAAYSPRENDAAVDESWPTHGTSSAAYTREKAYVERLIDSFALRNPDYRVVRLRPAFIFHERAATQQRRLFAGPLLPGTLVRPALVPLLPLPAGLLLQTVHADDIGRAFAAAVVSTASGAFNLCADEVLRPADIAAIFEARAVSVPPRLVRAALRGAWTVHAVPTPPELFDALMRVPVMSNQRALDELGWQPSVSASDAVRAFLDGLIRGAGHPTPPLDPKTSGPLRSHEVATGVGARD